MVLHLQEVHPPFLRLRSFLPFFFPSITFLLRSFSSSSPFRTLQFCSFCPPLFRNPFITSSSFVLSIFANLVSPCQERTFISRFLLHLRVLDNLSIMRQRARGLSLRPHKMSRLKNEVGNTNTHGYLGLKKFVWRCLLHLRVLDNSSIIRQQGRGLEPGYSQQALNQHNTRRQKAKIHSQVS